jgi:hypothetical protein
MMMMMYDLFETKGLEVVEAISSESYSNNDTLLNEGGDGLCLLQALRPRIRYNNVDNSNIVDIIDIIHPRALLLARHTHRCVLLLLNSTLPFYFTIVVIVAVIRTVLQQRKSYHRIYTFPYTVARLCVFYM